MPASHLNVGMHYLFLDLNFSNLKSNKGIAGIVKHSSNLFTGCNSIFRKIVQNLEGTNACTETNGTPAESP